MIGFTLFQTRNFRIVQTERVRRRQFYANGGKVSKRAEKTVGKGEIARYEQFLLFPQCFQKTCGHVKKQGLVLVRVKENVVETKKLLQLDAFSPFPISMFLNLFSSTD